MDGDCRTVKVAVVGNPGVEKSTIKDVIDRLRSDKVIITDSAEEADKVVMVAKLDSPSGEEHMFMYGTDTALDAAESDESDYRSAKDARSMRPISEMYTGKHRASTMYGITKGHKSNTRFKANRGKNFQRNKH